MKIRLATIDDRNELMRLAEQWLKPFFERDIKSRWLYTQLIDNEKHLIVVAEDEGCGRLFGFIDFIVWKDWLLNYKRVYIQHVYVDEEWRHQGIGKTMLQFIIKEYDPDFAVVTTVPDKYPYGVTLYEKMGFIIDTKNKWYERW